MNLFLNSKITCLKCLKENKKNILNDNTVCNKKQDKHAIVIKPNNLISYTQSTWAKVNAKMLSPKF